MKKYIHSLVLISIDIIVLLSIYFLTIKFFHYHKPSEYDGFNIISILILLMFFEGIYKFRYDFWQESLKILKAFSIGFFIVITISTFSKTNTEGFKSFIIIYFLLAIFILPITKRITKKLLYRFKYFKRSTYIEGIESEVKKFKEEFDKNWYLGEQYTTIDYECVIISSKNFSIDKLECLIQTHMQTCPEVYVVPYIQNINFAHSHILEYSNIRSNTIQVENKLLNKRNLLIKNIYDNFITIAILPIFFIIHIIISIAIKIDSKGNIFFKQPRVGKNGKTFICYKYRTMYENGNEILKTYLKNNPQEITYYAKYHKYQNDPRITNIGKILRSTSLDELPQIINILKGEMSLVGPRPYMLEEVDKLKDIKKFIYKVKPGITGLWQVSGRNELTFRERNELEVWYIQNWSLWADIVISIKTIKVVLLKIGAK